MSNKKKSFILHHDSLGILKKLDDEQAGKLFKAITEYSCTGEIECDLQTELLLFPFQSQFDRDNEAYQKVVERNKNNGSKGGRPKNPKEPKEPTGLSGLNKEPKKADSVNGSDKDSDSDKEKTKDLSLINDGFTHWWNLYPTSRRKNKGGCLTKFKSKCKNLTDEKIVELINVISNDIDKRVKEAEDIKFMPATETYLNQERWKDGE